MMVKGNFTKITKTEVGEFWIEDDIVFVKVLCRSLDENETKKNIDILNGMFNKIPSGRRLILAELVNLEKTSLSARKIISEVKLDKMAIVVKNPVTRVLGSFFLRIYKSSMKGKLFSNVDDAKKWLKEKEDSYG
jgi:hypothetical protein